MLATAAFNDMKDIYKAQSDQGSTASEEKVAEKLNGKRSYVPVELEKRKELLEVIQREGLTIKEAAQVLNINYSTAKHIVKTYKRTGSLETQLMKKNKRKQINKDKQLKTAQQQKELSSNEEPSKKRV